MNKRNFKEKYEKIVSKTVKRSFPELNDKKVFIKIKNLSGGSMFAGGWFFRGVILVDIRKYKNANRREIEGALVHELVHIKEYYSWNFFKYFFYIFRCSLLKMGYPQIERKTDKETIRRGYAKQLYACRIFRLFKSHPPYRMKLSESYLTPKEIKKYAQSIGKW